MKKYLFLSASLIFMISGYGQAWTKAYDHVDNCVCGLSLVEKSGKHGYVNEQGKLKIPLIYDDGMTFSEGKAGVKTGDKWGFIDSLGNEVVKPLYGEVFSFNEGFALVINGDNYGFIDASGKLVIPMGVY
jgi:hypothetical protein